jgi:RHS repeat-associated protein
MHRLASITSAGLGTVVYGYDAYGKLETITRGTTVYTIEYDSTWKLQTKTKVGSVALSENEYDTYKRLWKVTYANGFSARYEYDNLDRVNKIYQTENNTEELTYELIYNGEGDLYELRNYRTNRASFFEYDHAGRCMASKERSFTVTNGVLSYGSTELSAYGYQYDECNNLTKLTCSVLGSSWSTVYTYDNDNRPKTTTLNSGKVITNTYDAIGRLSKRTIGLSTPYETRFEYHLNGSNRTPLLHKYYNGNDSPFVYTYDNNGNITEITQGSTSISYKYDAANRLTRENNGVLNQTITYQYDAWGNILNKKFYAYTTATNPGTPTGTINYAYGNTAWGDQLTSYAGQTITYDSMGNPTSYRGYTFGWRGKQLTSADNGTVSATFEYNEDGLRQKKTVNNVSTDYYYNGSVLIGMQRGTTKYRFSYDASGNVVSVKLGTDEYYYIRNAQGDVVKLIDASGVSVVEYTYDTWGKAVTTTGTLAGTLGLFQPFRYRGYVYDWETGFYYLQSRYYDPTVGRFISADVLLSTGQGVLGYNCYAYCLGNPVGMVDDGGSMARGTNITVTSDRNPFSTKPPSQRTPDSRLRDAGVEFFSNPDDAAIAIAPKLGKLSQDNNREYYAAIYSKIVNGERVYYTGPIQDGSHNNVIEPTIMDCIDNVVSIFDSQQLEGFVHSHPTCNCHANNVFSGLIGDQGAAVLTGICYMMYPKGNKLYKITSADVLRRFFRGFDPKNDKEMDPYLIKDFNQ